VQHLPQPLQLHRLQVRHNHQELPPQGVALQVSPQGHKFPQVPPQQHRNHLQVEDQVQPLVHHLVHHLPLQR